MVDSEVNLNNSGVIIPDGMLAKVAGQNRFKVGNGVSTWSKLEYISSIALGNGLAFDENGQIVVDFSVMPTEKFEALVKSIRVPIWLEKNTNFYVSPDGSDVLSEGRGLSASLPFKTVKYCLKYIIENYNISSWTAYIIIADGDYSNESSLIIGDFQASIGKIILYGTSKENTILPRVRVMSDNAVCLYNLTIKPKDVANTTYWYALGCESKGCIENIVNVCLDISNFKNSSINYYAILCSGKSSSIRIWATSDNSIPSGIFIKGYDGQQIYTLISVNSLAAFEFTADINIESSFVTTNVIYCYTKAHFQRNTSLNINPGRAPLVILAENKSLIGRKFYARHGGTIDTLNGGLDFFPGNIAGIVEDSTYSWYK